MHEKEIIERSFTRPETFTLVDAIPEGDQWLASFKKAEGYKESWETWVWKLTDIKAGSGIKVYARSIEEKQFFITGYDEATILIVDFRLKDVQETGFVAAGHNVKLSPSGNYIVCIAQNPREYLNGLSLDFPEKGNSWTISFDGDTAIWRR